MSRYKYATEIVFSNVDHSYIAILLAEISKYKIEDRKNKKKKRNNVIFTSLNGQKNDR